MSSTSTGRPEKRKHKTLTLSVKAEIIKRLDKGEKLNELAKFYGVGRATIYDIRKNKHKIESYLKNADYIASDRQTLKSGEYPKVEEAVYAWFLQERRRHIPISGEFIREKAKFFYKQITNKDDFRASDGWLDKFKKRYGIRLLTITGEKLSCDVSAVLPFLKMFQKKVDELALIPDQVYNADESGLFWRLLPQKTFVHQAEISAPGRKMSKDRITFMPCSNASGTHKLELLVIGKAKNPRAFKNVNLPVIYKSQNRGWVTQEVFTQWFHENFVPSVKRFLKNKNLPQKALLLLDNAPGHPNEEQLKMKDSSIQVMFLPPNCTPLLQPMDQNIIQLVKSHYKKGLLFSIISQNDDIIKFLKGMNLKSVVFNLAYAWQSVCPTTIVSSWKKVWPSHPLLSSKLSGNAESTESTDFALQDAVTELNERISSETTGVRIDDISSWFTDDDEENVQIMTDDEIIQDVLEDNVNESEQEPDTVLNVPSVRYDEALSAFNTCLRWAEESNIKAEDVLTLKRLHEKVLKESFIKKKQKTIDSFFTKDL